LEKGEKDLQEAKKREGINPATWEGFLENGKGGVGVERRDSALEEGGEKQHRKGDFKHLSARDFPQPKRKGRGGGFAQKERSTGRAEKRKGQK